MRLYSATEKDVPLICELAERIWHDHYPAIITLEQIRYMLDEWYNASLIRKQINEGSQTYWMITEAGAEQPCGYVSISPKDHEGAYYLNKFYIDGRGKGIGAQAFKKALAHYPDLKEMRLNVNRRNFKSVNFYFKMGFIIESVMELQVGDRFTMDDFVMVYRHV